MYEGRTLVEKGLLCHCHLNVIVKGMPVSHYQRVALPSLEVIQTDLLTIAAGQARL